MKKNIRKIIMLLLVISVLLTGCSSGTSSKSGSTANAASTDTATSESTTNDTTSSDTTSNTANATTVSTTSEVVVDKEFTSGDLEVGYDESSAVAVTLKGSSIEASGSGVKVNGSVITISKKGTYVFSGTLDDGQIVVDAGDKDKVQIVLNGATIHCSNNAPIYVKNAEKVFITLETDTVNTLTDGTSYVQNDDNTVDGVIFSKADLTINGEGTLKITGNYKHGIVVKNKLTITSGTYDITAVKDDFNGNDGIRIKAGKFTLSSTNGNGISVKNAEDTTKGYVYICGGDINITNCVEGIEGTAIVVEGGKVALTSQDDGFNASKGSTAAANDSQGGFGGGGMENDTNCYISIAGGTININASGDGIDSNGSMYISGGTTYVSGPTESNNAGMDYNGTADITGGTIVVAGSSGMAQTFSDTSTQYSLMNNFTSAIEAGTEIKLTDSDGKVVASFKPDKQYQSVVICTPELTKDGKYTLTCGSQTADITLSSVVTSNGQTQMGGPGMGGHGMGGGHWGDKKPGDQTTTTTDSDSTTN